MILQKHPTLYHKARTGAIHQWSVWSDGDVIYTEHGIVGGKLQVSPRKASGKNVGRSNATTAEGQAALEAAAMHKFKLTRKYSLTPDDAQETVFLPMLAHEFEKAKNLIYPVYVQPKLDGVRCLAWWDDDQVRLTSRSGRDWSAPEHIRKGLESYLPKDMVLDGELYCHGVPFQDLTSWAKKDHADGTTQRLKLYVYDLVNDNPCDTRLAQLLAAFMYKGPFQNISTVEMVETQLCSTKKEVYDTQIRFVAGGYEGAMVRVADSLYELGHRSRGLLKVKSFKDAEYKVIGWDDGDGKDEGCVVYRCETADGRPFNVRPKATLEARRNLFKTAHKDVGKMYKVKFFELSEDGVPRFPVGLGFRESE